VVLPAAQEGLNKAIADAEQIRKQFVRIRRLNAQDFASEADLETDTHNLAVADSKLNSAKRQVETNLADGSEAAMAQTILAQASLNLAQIKLEQDSIRAAAAGRLISRSVEPGDIVQPGEILMVLAAQGETQLVVQIDEKNLGRLAIG
jgi:HlyD family secretion protein